MSSSEVALIVNEIGERCNIDSTANNVKAPDGIYYKSDYHERNLHLMGYEERAIITWQQQTG